MRNIAPHITRKRLLIEAMYTITVDADVVRQYLLELAIYLDLRTYGDPIIHSPSGQGKESNQGFDAFVPLIDSGISLYIWSNEKFLSCVIYTCKDFSTEKAIEFTKNYFQTKDFVSQEF
jgi:S-adenosylmethionine/arginine decarboxylase-like enzyme